MPVHLGILFYPYLRYMGSWNPKARTWSEPSTQVPFAGNTLFTAALLPEDKTPLAVPVKAPTGFPKDTWIAHNMRPGAREPHLAFSEGGKASPLRAGSLQDAEAMRVVSGYLKKQGLNVAKPTIVQHWQGDLLGNKQTVRLLSAASSPELAETTVPQAGDYSVTLLHFRHPKHGERVVALESNLFLRTTTEQVIYAHHLLGCADLNGDGRQEIAVVSRSPHYTAFTLYTFDGTTATSVLGNSWVRPHDE